MIYYCLWQERKCNNKDMSNMGNIGLTKNSNFNDGMKII